VGTEGGIEENIGGVPESLQHLIAQQVERLRPETQRLLEVASVAGAEFSAAAVAAGVGTEVDMIEEQCEGLARREHFLQASGTADWPDGTVAARYGFLHALYQEVLYHRLTARRRQRLHQQIGEREEAAYGDRAGERAAELAVHFEHRGGITSEPSSICNKQERTPAGGVPIRRRPPSLPKGWSCSKLCQTLPSAPSKSSRCKSLWALH
jgi:hypothetical protein